MSGSDSEGRLDRIENELGSFTETLNGHMKAQNIRDGRVEKTLASVLTTQQQVMDSTLEITVSSMKNEFAKIEKQLKDLKIEQAADIREVKQTMAGSRDSSENQPAEPDVSTVTVSNERVIELEDRLMKVNEEVRDSQQLYANTLRELHETNEKWKETFEEVHDSHENIEGMWRTAFEKERNRSRALFQQLQSIKGNIRVMARIRPASKDTPAKELVDFGPAERGDNPDQWSRMRVRAERKNFAGDSVADIKTFNFERIFGSDETNGDIFDEIKDLTQCAMDGEKVCIFSYGQTGSGKTYTFSSADGIIPRTLDLIFDTIAQAPQTDSFFIDMSVVEIYLDSVFDLLQEPVGGEKVSVRVGQASFQPLSSLQGTKDALKMANSIRATSSTSMNADSSRSHLILTFRIRRFVLMGGDKSKTTIGLLNLVDLAGSERSASAGLSGKQLNEGIKINQSLSSLNRVITALGNGTHVSFETSLTRALRSSLSAGSKTLMFVMVSPLKKDLSVSLQTLEKGAEATKARLASLAQPKKKAIEFTGAARPSAIPTPGGGASSARGPATTGRSTPAPTGRSTPATPRSAATSFTARSAAGSKTATPSKISAPSKLPSPPSSGASTSHGDAAAHPKVRRVGHLGEKQ